MATVKRGPLTKLAWKAHRWIFNVSGGRLGSRVVGMPVLALTTTGRNSGQPRQVLLTYLDHADAFVVAGSNAGHDSHPAWWLNMEADPKAVVHVNQTRIPVRARLTAGGERHDLWDRFVEAHDGYAEYATRTEREIPVVALEPVAM